MNTLGRSQSIGLAFTFPVDELSFDVGIGGVSSSPFNTPNALDTLTASGFAEADVTGKGLENITPLPSGIPFKNGSAVNAFVITGFKVGIFDADVKGVIELLGSGGKMHQGIFNFKTSGKIYDVVVATGLEVGLALYQNEIHYETAVISSFGYEF